MGRPKKVSDADLLEAARAAFVESGLRASTREIAKKAGVSEAILFQRYHTKADLFLAAMTPPALDLAALTPSPHRSGERAIGELARALLDYFRLAAPVLTQVMAHQDFQFERFASAHPGNPLAALRGELMNVIAGLQQQGRISDAEASGVALTLFGSMYSIAVFERFGAHGGRFPDSLVDATIGAIWKGLQPPKRARKALSKGFA